MERFTFFLRWPLFSYAITSTYSTALLMPQLNPAMLASVCNGWCQTNHVGQGLHGFPSWPAPRKELQQLHRSHPHPCLPGGLPVSRPARHGGWEGSGAGVTGLGSIPAQSRCQTALPPQGPLLRPPAPRSPEPLPGTQQCPGPAPLSPAPRRGWSGPRGRGSRLHPGKAPCWHTGSGKAAGGRQPEGADAGARPSCGSGRVSCGLRWLRRPSEGRGCCTSAPDTCAQGQGTAQPWHRQGYGLGRRGTASLQKKLLSRSLSFAVPSCPWWQWKKPRLESCSAAFSPWTPEGKLMLL